MSTRTERYLDERAALAGSPPGPGQRRARSNLSDDLLRGLLEDHQVVAGVADVAVVAVGGYGRACLSPGSDLDLVLLHPEGHDVTELTHALLYPLWDAGIAVDHSVRTLAEVRSVAAEDLPAALGLLDARHVAGPAGPTEALRGAVLGDWRARAKVRLPQLRDSCSERAGRFGELAFLLEPNLKEARGGLRDLVALRAVAASWVADPPHADLTHAEVRLLDVRDALHAGRRRPSDRLLLQEQDRVAQDLGYPDADALMQVVSSAARTVAHAADLTWRRVEHALPPAQNRRLLRRGRTRSPLPPRALAAGVAEQGGEAVLTDGRAARTDPELLLRLAACAAQSALPLAPSSVDRLAVEAAPMPTPWTPGQRDWFVRLLGAGPELIGVWESLDQAGLVVRLLPEWRALRSRPQRNALHRFTVDRHLVETAVQAARWTTGVQRPDLLLVAALLHDVGKALPGDHSEVGAPVMEVIAERMGFDERDVATLGLLVRHHLLLPAMATSRDLQDPATVTAVLDRVPDLATLRLLHALTESDARAAGPTAWTPWRAGLVAQLVDAVERAWAGSGSRAAEPQVDPNAHPGLGSAALLEVGVQHEGTTELTITVAERPGLLALVTGVLALARLTVRSARLSSTGEVAAMTFAVAAEHGDPIDAAVLRDGLRRALAGSVDVSAKVAARAAAYPGAGGAPLAPPSARIVPGASASATVLEVHAHDRPGLVHLIARAITDAGAEISSAVVTTLGSEAVDAFYLVGADKAPVADDVARSVAGAVEAALER